MNVLNFIQNSSTNKTQGLPVKPAVGWRIEQLDKESHEILKKSGLSNDKHLELSKKAIFLKFSRSLNVQLPEIQSRIYYGFLEKKKLKRWLFLISPRPLTDKEYEIDDTMLEDNKIPKNTLFDTLYYFTVDNENDDSPPRGSIVMR